MNNQKENEFLMIITGFIAVITLAFFMYEEGKFDKSLNKSSKDGFDVDNDNLTNDLNNIASDMLKAKEKFLKDAA